MIAPRITNPIHGVDEVPAPRLRRRNAIGLVLFPLLTTTACVWREKIAFSSPSKRSTIVLTQPWIAEAAGCQMELRTPDYDEIIFRAPDDVTLDFVHVVWTQDERLVGVFVTGLAVIKFAFDLSTRSRAEFRLVEDIMRKDIAVTYSVLERVGIQDPLVWARSDQGKAWFRWKYPHASTS